jgi:pilus assembly protein Flp/PilA
MFKKVMNFIKEEEGAGLAEYALLLVLIALVVIASLGPLGDAIAAAFDLITTELEAVPAT